MTTTTQTALAMAQILAGAPPTCARVDELAAAFAAAGWTKYTIGFSTPNYDRMSGALSSATEATADYQSPDDPDVIVRIVWGHNERAGTRWAAVLFLAADDLRAARERFAAANSLPGFPQLMPNRTIVLMRDERLFAVSGYDRTSGRYRIWSGDEDHEVLASDVQIYELPASSCVAPGISHD